MGTSESLSDPERVRKLHKDLKKQRGANLRLRGHSDQPAGVLLWAAPCPPHPLGTLGSPVAAVWPEDAVTQRLSRSRASNPVRLLYPLAARVATEPSIQPSSGWSVNNPGSVRHAARRTRAATVERRRKERHACQSRDDRLL